jgi:exopolyphosphatase / guanosine-5'-triphosphate,3'-diphosphate pyrophosphatase
MPTFAAVDIGANSVRLKIGQLDSRRLKIVHEDRQVTRLGEQVFRGGFLSPKSMGDTVKVLRRFHRAAQKYAADPVRVVATSALRQARNGQAFIDWVHSATGWKVETISGIEEARLIHLGLVSNVRISAWPVLMVDLGGGSCELTVSSSRHIEFVVSLPLGAVRLTEEFLRHDPARKPELERLRGFIDRELGRAAGRIVAARVRAVIATSGTAAALAGAAAAARKQGSPAGLSATRREVIKIAKLLARKTAQQRNTYPGIGTRRAEIIVAGAAVFARLLERCELRGFRYSPLGLRDGLLAQMAAEHGGPASRRQLESDRWDALLAATRHYRVDQKHALQVRAHAMQLFTEMRSVHRLPAPYREWLSAAAMLYEVGNYVNRSGRHRHTHYIISNSEILGYTPEERRVIAGIARYLGNSRPAPADPPIKVLPFDEREHVVKASLLLRLARALELGRGRCVRRIKASPREARVTLTVTAKRGAEMDLELWSLEKERAYFRAVFGRELVVEAA